MQPKQRKSITYEHRLLKTQKPAVIGEAAARVSDELKARYPDVPWPKIVAFRNILVHAYLGIDWDEVWRAASKEAPPLRDQIELILRAEFGEAERPRS